MAKVTNKILAIMLFAYSATASAQTYSELYQLLSTNVPSCGKTPTGDGPYLLAIKDVEAGVPKIGSYTPGHSFLSAVQKIGPNEFLVTNFHYGAGRPNFPDPTISNFFSIETQRITGTPTFSSTVVAQRPTTTGEIEEMIRQVELYGMKPGYHKPDKLTGLNRPLGSGSSYINCVHATASMFCTNAPASGAAGTRLASGVKPFPNARPLPQRPCALGRALSARPHLNNATLAVGVANAAQSAFNQESITAGARYGLPVVPLISLVPNSIDVASTIMSLDQHRQFQANLVQFCQNPSAQNFAHLKASTPFHIASHESAVALCSAYGVTSPENPRGNWSSNSVSSGSPGPALIPLSTLVANVLAEGPTYPYTYDDFGAGQSPLPVAPSNLAAANQPYPFLPQGYRPPLLHDGNLGWIE